MNTIPKHALIWKFYLQSNAHFIRKFSRVFVSDHFLGHLVQWSFVGPLQQVSLWAGLYISASCKSLSRRGILQSFFLVRGSDWVHGPCRPWSVPCEATHLLRRGRRHYPRGLWSQGARTKILLCKWVCKLLIKFKGFALWPFLGPPCAVICCCLPTDSVPPSGPISLCLWQRPLQERYSSEFFPCEGLRGMPGGLGTLKHGCPGEGKRKRRGKRQNGATLKSRYFDVKHKKAIVLRKNRVSTHQKDWKSAQNWPSYGNRIFRDTFFLSREGFFASFVFSTWFLRKIHKIAKLPFENRFPTSYVVKKSGQNQRRDGCLTLKTPGFFRPDKTLDELMS